MGTIQRLPGVIKLARVFFGFSIISSRRSTLSGALAPALTGSSVLHRGWQQQPHNYNEAGLMWWQDRLPALLSLSFVPGLLGVPPVLSSCPCTCSAPLSLKKKHTAASVYWLFIWRARRIKATAATFTPLQFAKKKVCSLFLFIRLYKCTLGGAARCSYSLPPPPPLATSFEAESRRQRPVGQTGLLQWGEWKLSIHR